MDTTPHCERSLNAKRVYDALAGGYNRWFAVIDRLTPVTRLRSRVLARAHGDVLEVAIGTGNTLRLYPRDVRLTGVDFSEPMLALASEEATKLGIVFTPRVADAEALPFPDASFDCVVCSLAACTFEHPARVFAELRRVLRPGGKALLVEHVLAEGPIVSRFLRMATPLAVKRLGCHPDRRTDRTLAAAGFTIDHIEHLLSGILVGISATPT